MTEPDAAVAQGSRLVVLGSVFRAAGSGWSSVRRAMTEPDAALD